MLYQVAADAVLLLHGAYVLFVLLGGLLALRWRRVLWVHLPAAAWGVTVEFAGWVCPLTPLENWLRERGGEAGYPGDFIEHWMLPVLYPAVLTRGSGMALGFLALAANLLIYRRVLSRPL